MKKIQQTTLILLFQCLCMHAQDTTWNSSVSKDGKVEVHYRFTSQLDSNNQEILIIEDVSTIRESLDFNKCVLLMKDVSRHREFSGDQISKKVREISDGACIVYYYTKNPWPVPNSDCVSEMKYRIDTVTDRAEFILTAAPGEYPISDVNRMIHYKVSYSFQDLGNGITEITVKGRTSPPVKVPFWLVKSAFPSAPEKALRSFASIIKDE